MPRAEAAGLERKRLLIKRGDVLIWSGNLAHGGGEVADDNLSRRPLVGHYMPRMGRTAVLRPVPRPGGLRRYGGGTFASMHYDVTTGR